MRPGGRRPLVFEILFDAIFTFLWPALPACHSVRVFFPAFVSSPFFSLRVDLRPFLLSFFFPQVFCAYVIYFTSFVLHYAVKVTGSPVTG